MPITTKQPEDRSDQSIGLLNFTGERTKPWRPSMTSRGLAPAHRAARTKVGIMTQGLVTLFSDRQFAGSSVPLRRGRNPIPS